MNTFFTSDLHLGHANIIVYANRPWLKDGDLLEPYTGGKPKWVSKEIALARADKMNDRIIAEINMRCKKEDTLIHVGDFCCYGNERGMEGNRTKAEEWENKINPKVIHIFGNHDKNNSVKGCISGMVCKISHWTCWVQHLPPWNIGAIEAPKGCNAYICGHVHDKWKTVTHRNLPVINVGTDVNNLRPFSKNEVIKLLAHTTKETSRG